MDDKIVWGIGQGAKDHTAEINPAQPTLARYVNTLAKWGVPKQKRHIIVMFHQRSDDFDIVMTNESFKAKHGKGSRHSVVSRRVRLRLAHERWAICDGLRSAFATSSLWRDSFRLACPAEAHASASVCA